MNLRPVANIYIWSGKSKANLLLILVFAGLLLIACSSSPRPAAVEPSKGSAIAIDALPDEPGRGYPVVEVDGLDNDGSSLNPGDLTPDVRLRLDDGSYLHLRDLRGRPLLINFWATWCGPCRLEMPEFVDAANGQEDLIVLAVNVQEDLDQIRPFVNEFQMPMPVVLDQAGEMRKLYEVRGMPTTIFVDREGRVVTRWAGLLTADKLQELLAEIL